MESGYDLRDKTVLITGASRGLGAALAVEFGRAGARVTICARDRDALERVAAAVREVGAHCRPARVDIRDSREVERWVRSVSDELGTPTTLVNNASVLGPRVSLAEHGVEAWRETLEVNLTGAFLATRAVLPFLRGRADGSIINVSSGAAVPPRVAWGAYAVSKHALEGFSLNLAAELKDSGVRVNLVDPGAMRTMMRAEAYPAEDPATLKAPERAAPVFLWLASDAARGVSGRRFRADEWTPR
jgi:NAD(P)-dependent dehydrogenase (short-subunit alcohol dehydrogenase family)